MENSKGENMIGTIECPDCGQSCNVKETKKNKPYYACEECGTQHFYRTPEGIRRLIERMKRSDPAPKADAEKKEVEISEPITHKSVGWGLL